MHAVSSKIYTFIMTIGYKKAKYAIIGDFYPPAYWETFN